MAITDKKDLLDKLAPPGISTWEEQANWRKENESWLARSQEIALKVLRTLRQKEMSRRDLAVLLNCSAQHAGKLVSGKENLTLETVSRLEEALNIRLISIPSFSMTMEVKLNAQRYYAPEGRLVEQPGSATASQPLTAQGSYFMNEQLEVA